MNLFGRKKEKTEIDLIEDQIKFYRRLVNDSFTRSDAFSRLKELESHLIKMHSLKIPERIKSIEDAIGELYLMGREEKK